MVFQTNSKFRFLSKNTSMCKKITKEEIIFLLEELQPLEDDNVDNLKIHYIREAIENCLKRTKNKEVEIENFLPLAMVDFIVAVLSVKEESKISRTAQIKTKLSDISWYYKEMIKGGR